MQSPRLTAGDPAFARVLRSVAGHVSATGLIDDVRSPLAPADTGQISENRHAALVQFSMRGDAETARNA